MVTVFALMATSDKPYLATRVFPPMSLIDAKGGSLVLLTAELKGPEVEKFYCPQVVWELGDTEAKEESDCPPFEKRHECVEDQKGCGVIGFKLNPKTGAMEDVVKECPCTIIGYPRIWRRKIYAPAHPDGEPWEVWVRLVKNGKVVARQSIKFWVRG